MSDDTSRGPALGLVTSPPVVAFDEAGNTGQNLLDPDQPVFVLASVHMDSDGARDLIAAVTPPGSREAKFSTLRTSGPGRRRVQRLLRSEQITRDTVRVSVYHKPYMITTKIVDVLVETWHHRNGIDLYENAAHIGLANLLHHVVPTLCGADSFREWQERFVAMIRKKSPETVDAFYEFTQELRARNTQHDFDIYLEMLGHTRTVVDEAVKDHDPTALDPAVPALVQLAAEWTAALKMPFDLVHDRSKPIEYENAMLSTLMSLSETPRVFESVGSSYAFPIQAPGIRFADSREVPQLQIADLVAGAAATLFRARAKRQRDQFAETIRETHLPRLLTGAVWPDVEVTPAGLDADRRPGSAQVDFISRLIGRRATATNERASGDS